MKIKVGDLVFIGSKNESFYEFIDTDPRFLNYGEVISINDDKYEVDIGKYSASNIVTYSINEKRIMTFDEYIKRANDISYHLKCNSEMVEAIKEDKKSMHMSTKKKFEN